MVAGYITRENESIVSIDRVWNGGILDVHYLIQKLLPDLISSVETIEGDGGVGTITTLYFTEDVKDFDFITEKIEVLDDENYIVKKSFIDGGLIGQRLSSYSVEIELEEVNYSGTLGKIRLEYDTIDDTYLSDDEEEEIMKGIFMIIKVIEGYLIENPTYYA